MRKLLTIMIILAAAGTFAFLACNSSSSDDDTSDDVTADDTGDDTAADDTSDDDNHFDDDADDASDDTADDTAADDDTTGNTWVDGGFDLDSWAPCATTGCSMFIYATVSNAFMLQAYSNLPTSGPIEQLFAWQMDGSTTAGDIDLTITPGQKATITTFVIIYVNATVVSRATINYDALYVSTAGNLHITDIGQNTGDAFSAELQDVTFTEAALSGANLTINFAGKSGHINSVMGSGTTLRLPLK